MAVPSSPSRRARSKPIETVYTRVVKAPSEQEVQDLARRITEAGASERARLFHLGRWSERILDWAMSHPSFKTQLFRLIDVLPACRDDADVLRHMTEYFDGVEVPRVLGFGLDMARVVPL